MPDHRMLRQLCRYGRPLDLQGPGRDLQPAVRGARRQGRGEGQDRRRLHSEPVRRRRHLRRPQRARKGPPTFWHKGNVVGPQRRDHEMPLRSGREPILQAETRDIPKISRVVCHKGQIVDQGHGRNHQVHVGNRYTLCERLALDLAELTAHA